MTRLPDIDRSMNLIEDALSLDEFMRRHREVKQAFELALAHGFLRFPPLTGTRQHDPYALARTREDGGVDVIVFRRLMAQGVRANRRGLLDLSAVDDSVDTQAWTGYALDVVRDMVGATVTAGT